MKLFLLGVLILLGAWTVWGYYSSHVEEAAYTVIQEKDGYEIREYAPHLEAQTTVTGSYDNALNEGFRIIAGYIFGGNTARTQIAMTAPVTESKTTGESIAMTAPVQATLDEGTRTISFVLPSSYTLATLPVPNDSRVKIVEVGEMKVAALKFHWFWRNTRITEKKEALLALLARDGMETVGMPRYAGYNAPWTPPWMVRNEILVEVK